VVNWTISLQQLDSKFITLIVHAPLSRERRRTSRGFIGDSGYLSGRRKGKVSPYSIAERGVPELIRVLGSQSAGDVSHKPGGRLPLLSARPAVTLATLKEGCCQFRCLVNRGTMRVNSLPETVTRQRRGCDLNPGRTAPESSTLTTRLQSHLLSVWLYDDTVHVLRSLPQSPSSPAAGRRRRTGEPA